jgi:hypothetical protein
MSEALRPVEGSDGLYAPYESMVMVAPGLYSTDGFTESSIPGLYEFSVLDPAFTLYMDGNPSVEIFFTNYVAGTARVRLYRYSEGRTWLVRGGVDIAPSVAVRDYEVPSGVTSTYRAEMFNAAGVSLGFNTPASVTMPAFGPILHQPLDPALFAEVILMVGTAEKLSRPTPRDVVYTEGSSVGRHIGSRRRGLSRTPLLLEVESQAAGDMVQAMLGTYETEQVGVLCLRTPPPTRLPRTFFFSSDEMEELDVNIHYPVGGVLIRYGLDADEVEPPFPGLVKPTLTYDDIDTVGSYDVQDSMWATYTDRDRAYELAGQAG